MYAGRLVECGPVTPDLRRARPPVHPGAARLHPPYGRRRPRAPHRHRGPAPGPGRPAVRLRLPSPLPARDGRSAASRRRPRPCWLRATPRAAGSRSRRRLDDLDSDPRGAESHQALPGEARALRQDARGGAGGGRRELLHRARPDPGPGGRVRLRQDHHRQAGAAARGAHRRRPALRGQDIGGLGGDDVKQYRRAVQAVFQDPFASLNPRMRVDAIISEPLVTHERSTAARGGQAGAPGDRPGRAAGAGRDSSRTSSRAASASASRSRGRSRCRPSWSCSTSRCPRSTSPSAPRS